MHLMIVGLVNLVGVSLAASCLHSPVSWSPDGQWLAYTLVVTDGGHRFTPGWLLDSSRMAADVRPASPGDPGTAGVIAGRHAMWVTHRTSRVSYLLETAGGPLSAPGWAPDGQRLAYLRFQPEPGGGPTGRLTGHCELVVQDSIDRKQVVLTLPDQILRPGEVEEFAAMQPIWSPDGESLLVSRPGPEPAILVVDTVQRRLRKTLVGALRASWSPEGTRLVAVVTSVDDPAEQRLQLLGPDLGSARQVPGTFGLIDEPPIWTPDGQSILFAGRRAQIRSQGIELIRVQLDSGFASPLLPFVSLPGTGRGHGPTALLGRNVLNEKAPRVSVGFDRDRDQCAYAAELPGQDPMIGFCSLRVPQTFKRFPPIDPALRVGALTMDPGGQLIAVRVEGASKAGPAFLSQLGSEEVTLLAPDAPARAEWRATLAEAALALLRSGLPGTTPEGTPLVRNTILPVAGEFSAQSLIPARLRRLGKAGQPLVRTGEPDPQGRASRGPDGGLDDFSLFFDTLAGDYRNAEADLDAMVETSTNPEMRLRLLALRAQVLHADGQLDRARSVVDYLLTVHRPERRLVEDTPAGRVLSTVDDPVRSWLYFLQHRIGQTPEAPPAPSSDEAEEEEIDLRIPAQMEIAPGIPAAPDGRPRPPRPRLGPGPDVLRRFELPRAGQPGQQRVREAPGGVIAPPPPQPFRPVAPLLPRYQPRERADRRP